MMLNTRIVVALTTLAVTFPLFASTPENFIYTSSGDLDAAAALIARRDIGGAQIVYNWRALEPEKNRYDFSSIERDLARLSSKN